VSRSAAGKERAIRQRLKDDLVLYAARCLKIRSKAGRLEPLVLNSVQRHIHERLEAQRAATGRVRALILKARQPGVSTYVGARFYWKVTHGRGLRAFILTHRDQATANLFAMAKRFTAYDKAAAAAIGTAVTTVIAALTPLDPEVVGAIGTLVTAGLVWLVPNKQAAQR
jgi:hypothetical protein